MKKAKVSDVQALFATYRKTNNIKILDKAIKLSTEVCLSPVYSEDEKIMTLREILLQAAVEEKTEEKAKEENSLSTNPKHELELEIRSINMRGVCSDFICKYRDSLLYLKGADADNMISLLRRIVKLHEVPVTDRVYTAVHFYNACQYHVCYPCFADLAEDRLLPLDSRIECIKFLYASGESEERNIAKRVLLDIISDERYECDARYGAIRSYIPNTGIRTIMNMQKLKIPYEEEFVCVLQKAFFANNKNNVKYRVLSGQHLLQMSSECVTDDEKEGIINALFAIADDETHTENERADALDVILRLGQHTFQTQARVRLKKLGESKNKSVYTNTIYTNSQNVHDSTINKCIESYLEKVIEDAKPYRTLTLDETLRGISEYISEIMPISADTDEYVRKRKAIANSLSRIKIDTATFTKYGITSVEVLQHVYSRMISGEFDEKTIALLKERFLEELIEMDDTCSTGGATRLVNVFSGVDDTIKISWADQLLSNVVGRIGAKVRACENADLQATLTFGMMDGADEADRKVYLKFVNECFDDIERELYTEFVKEGHVSEEEFKTCMQDICDRYV